MTDKTQWEVDSAFSDLIDADSPVTHADLDRAFRRAGVSVPREEGLRYLAKSQRILKAFDAANDGTDERADDLIKALMLTLTRNRVFQSEDDVTQQMVAQLRTALTRAGWDITESGEISRRGSIEVQAGGREALEQHLKRLRNSGNDISLMVGAAKDTLEASAKFVLEERGHTHKQDESVEALVNRAMKLVGISTQPADLDSEASKALAHINQAVPKIARSVRLVRNDQGAGHGRTTVSSMSMPEAAFVRDLTLSVVNFLLAEHQARPSGSLQEARFDDDHFEGIKW